MNGTFSPRPGAAPVPRMIAVQALLEARMILRNGEQLLLTMVIPLLVLTVFANIDVMDLGSRAERVNYVTPGVLALAVISTAFTGLAIGTGFERRYGALKRLGATPLPRAGLLVAKGFAVLAVELLQVALISAVALASGWQPRGSTLSAALLLLAGTAAFSALGLLLAGALRAEATLAAANLLFLLFLVTGGIAMPLDRFPDGVDAALRALPAGALAEGLRDVIHEGTATPWLAVAVLVAWAVLAGLAATRTFRWE